MGKQVTIDMAFAQHYSPKNLVLQLINDCSWSPVWEGRVTMLLASDRDNFEWQEIRSDDFDLMTFISSHGEKDKIGLVIVNKDQVGCHALIYPNWISFSLSINRVYINGKNDIPDFSWYMKEFASFMEKIKIASIQCELVY